MYELKRLSIDFGFAPKEAKAQVLSKLFVDLVDKNGRISEVSLVGKFFMKTNSFAALRMIPRASKLLRKGRMPLLPHRIEGTTELQKCASAMSASLVSGIHAGKSVEEAN
jgi:hypothetical protein